MNLQANIAGNQLPTIEVDGHTLTIDIAKQLDSTTIRLQDAKTTPREQLLQSIEAHQPIARVHANYGGIELIGTHPATGYLVLLQIANNYGIEHDADKETWDAHKTMQELAEYAAAFPLAVLPKPGSPIAK